MTNAKVSASDVFFGRAAPTERSFRNKIVGLIALQEMGINIIVMPIALGTAALAGASFNDLRLLLLLVEVFLACGVAMMTNDIIDAERDKTKWPLKPLATGLLSKSEALLCTAIWAVIGIVIAIVFLNWLILALGLLVLAGNLVYSRYLRDNIGYLMASVIAVFFVGVAIYLYAQISWLFVVVLAVFTAGILTQARNLGDNRSREKLETGFKLESASFSIYWLSIAVFAWIK